MWTVQNVSQDTVTVTDTPIPVTWMPGQQQTVPMADFLHSAQLGQAVQNQQLCVVSYGTFQPLPRFAPLTYVVVGTVTATGLQPATLTTNGQGAPLTLAPFASGEVLLNVTTLTSGSSLAVNFEGWDGAVYYPTEPVLAAVTAPGAVQAGWPPSGVAGRFTWTVVGSVTASLLYQLRP